MTTDTLSFAVALAPELSRLRGTPWHARMGEHGMAEIVRFDGAKILLRRSRRQGYVTLHPCTPAGWNHHRTWTAKESTILLDRHPRHVAAFLCHTGSRKSFMARYEAAYSAEARVVAEERRRVTDDACFLAAVAETGGGRIVSATDPRTQLPGLTVRPLSNGDCEIRGTISRDVMIRLAGMLRADGYGEESEVA